MDCFIYLHIAEKVRFTSINLAKNVSMVSRRREEEAREAEVRRGLRAMLLHSTTDTFDSVGASNSLEII